MKSYTFLAALWLWAIARAKQFDAYLADLSHQQPRSIRHGWDNLTVETNTGTFIGMYNDTYPNVRQFLRIPFAQVREEISPISAHQSYVFSCTWTLLPTYSQ
jgi:hypothetical protein